MDEQINNNHNPKEENENKMYNINNGSSILIKSYNDSFKNQNHYLNKSDYFCINKNQRVSDREKKKEKEPIDNMQKKNKKKNEEEEIKIKEKNMVYANNNSNFRLIKKKEELNKLTDIQKYKKMSAKNSDKNKKENKNKTNNTDNINISIYKNINFDQPNDIIPISNKASSKIITQLIKSKSYSDKEKMNKYNNKNNKNNGNHEKFKSMNITNENSIKKSKVEKYNEKIMNYLYRKKDESSQKNNEGNNDNKKENKLKKGKSINNSTEIKQSESNKLSTNLNNNNSHIKINSMFNEAMSMEEILSKGQDKKPKNNKKSENKKKLKNSSNIKIKLEKNKNETKDNFKWITQIQKPLINNKRNNKIEMKLGKNNQNKVYKSNGTKFSNINKTTNENQNVLKKRFNLNNKKNNNILLTKGLKNQLIKKNHRLKPSISFNYIDNNLKIMKNFKSKDNRYKFGKKQGLVSINDEELYYRNNSYDYDNMNDEMNRTPKKKSIFNRVKPNKLIEAFRKELADNSKKENVIKLKKNFKV